MDAGPYRRHVSGRLVPQDDRGHRGVLVGLDVQIGPADTAPGDGDDYLAGAGYRIGKGPE